VFASWEGEEFDQVRSIAWLEEKMPWVKATNVAYLNIIISGAGTSLHVKASPLLYRIVREATKLVPSSNETVPGQTFFDGWDKYFITPGGGDAI
jgi:N-acetylated-alpha-linked acidic dipeptidase